MCCWYRYIVLTTIRGNDKFLEDKCSRYKEHLLVYVLYIYIYFVSWDIWQGEPAFLQSSKARTWILSLFAFGVSSIWGHCACVPEHMVILQWVPWRLTNCTLLAPRRKITLALPQSGLHICVVLASAFPVQPSSWLAEGTSWHWSFSNSCCCSGCWTAIGSQSLSGQRFLMWRRTVFWYLHHEGKLTQVPCLCASMEASSVTLRFFYTCQACQLTCEAFHFIASRGNFFVCHHAHPHNGCRSTVSTTRQALQCCFLCRS